MVKRRPSPPRHHPNRPSSSAPDRRHLTLNIRSALTLALTLILPLLGTLLFYALPSYHHPSRATTAQQQATSASAPPKEDARTTTTASMSSATLRRAAPLVFPARGRHTATVIFAHGLGDSGAGWADAVELWSRRERLSGVKFVLPNAPTIPISVNMGFQMPGWFDIKTLGASGDNFDHDEDTAGVLASQAYFHGLIQDEIAAGVPAERILVGGFSQGGAMGILAGLTAPVRVAGVVGLSSWLLLNQTFKDRLPEGNPNAATPVFMGHGDRDPMVRYELAVATQKKLQELGYDVTLKTYRGMEHSACLEELNEVEAFIASRLPPQEG